MVRLFIEIDNSMCQADIDGLNISINNTVGLRSSDGSTADNYVVFSKSLPGVRAGEKRVGNEAINEQFQLMADRRQIKPTCNGKLLSSVYDLNLGLSHDVACHCCAGSPGVSLRVMIFPSPMEYQLPSTFTSKSWQPRMMPPAQIVLNNAFENFKIGQMMSQAMKTFPPPPPPPPQPGYNNVQMNAFTDTNTSNQGFNGGNQGNQRFGGNGNNPGNNGNNQGFGGNQGNQGGFGNNNQGGFGNNPNNNQGFNNGGGN